MDSRPAPPIVRHPEAKPTAKQVYALARELCAQAGEEFPGTRGEASRLIERLRAVAETPPGSR
jgi:hypothetical protein